MRKALLLTFLLMFAVTTVLSQGPKDAQAGASRVEDFLDLQGLNESRPDWRILDQDLSPTKGRLALHQSKWLMYFLHWRPLTEANKTLTIEYVRNHMLNFWGQGMNFKLLNIDGEMEVCGHKAVFTEGTVMDGAVYTRFIVWNCPQTNRQFTADCNINLRRKTPQDLLDLQRAITLTICCHEGGPRPQPSAGLNKRYHSAKWNVRFSLPPDWRTADYDSKEWFPQGMSAQSGSLWTLLTDSQKHLRLFWEERSDRPSEDMFKSFLQKCSSPLAIENVTSQIVGWELGSLQEKRGLWVGEGTYEHHQKAQNQEATTPYRFQGFLWKEGSKTYFLLAALVQVKEFWNIPNDLSPSDERFERFVGEEVLPNVRGIPIGAYSSARTYPQPLSEDPANFLKETDYLDYSQPVFQEVMDKILTPQMSLEQKLGRLFYYVRDDIPFGYPKSLTASGALKTHVALCYTKAMAFVSFCRKLGVPAKLAAGHWAIKADARPNHHRHGIAKIFVKGRWIYVDTVSNRDAWNWWRIAKSMAFDPPRFSFNRNVVVGPEYYEDLTFEDYDTDDVPEYWLRETRDFLETGQ